MQRVFSTVFSGDARYLMCGSDEGNIRMWKSVAWRKEGTLNFRAVLIFSLDVIAWYK